MLTSRIASNSWYSHTVQELFVQQCLAHPEKPALVYRGNAVTFGELHDTVNRLSHALLQMGIQKGDVVSVLPSPTPEFAAIYFAVLQSGAVINPLNLLWGKLEFEGVLARNTPRVIISVDEYGSRNYLQMLHDAIPGLQAGVAHTTSTGIPELAHLVCVSTSGKHHDGLLMYQDLLERGGSYDAASLRAMARAGSATDIQFICQTSGTTGLSKSALWNHRSPLATVNFMARNLAYTEDDTYINLSPFYHNSGICALTLNLAYAGTTLHLMDSFNPVQALELIAEHRITSTFGFDAHWQGMRRAPNFDASRFTINKAVFAGEPNTYDLVLAMCPAGAKLNNLYAQTENGPLVSFADHDCMDYTINKYTHGRPLPGVQIVIKHIETGERLPQGMAGEICYKSPFMFQGYLKQPDATDKAYDAEGYFHSGDFGHLDNGYITFLGRLGGVVKSGGENVSTSRVSTLLLDRFPDEFEDVKTIGVSDPYWGAKVVSFVRMRPGLALRPTAELRAECRSTMAAYEIPQAFLVWEGEWPASPEGKIDFKRLQAQATETLACAGNTA